MNFIGKQLVSDHIKAARKSLNFTSSKLNINFDDFNYPWCIKIIHFDFKELRPPYSSLVYPLWIMHLLIFACSIINLINCFVQTVTGGFWTLIVYSIFFFPLINLLTGFVFYRGYRGCCENSDLLRLYKAF